MVQKAETIAEDDDPIQYQDVAIAFLMDGMDGLYDLYTSNPIDPDVSVQAWSALHEQGHTTARLATFFAYVHGRPFDEVPQA